MATRELERSVAVRVCGSVCGRVKRLFSCKRFLLKQYVCIAASQANENALLFKPKYPDVNLRMHFLNEFCLWWSLY